MGNNINNGGIQFNGDIENSHIGSIHFNQPPQQENQNVNDSWKDIAFDFVAQNQLKESLAEVIKANKSEDVKIQVIQLLGRLSKIELEKMAGTVSIAEEAIEINQIRQAIVILISRL